MGLKCRFRGLSCTFFTKRRKETKNVKIPRKGSPSCALNNPSNTVYEQRRVDLATFRAVPASTWGQCPQVLVFAIVWDTPGKAKVAKWSSAPASILDGFNEIYVVYGPKNPYKTREERQSCQVDPCLPPYTPPLCILPRSCLYSGRFGLRTRPPPSLQGSKSPKSGKEGFGIKKLGRVQRGYSQRG